MTAELLASALVFAFVACCIVSAILQVLAWSRHSREGVPVTVRALWQPEGFFDETGLRQIRFARRLLTAGAVAYLMYGGLILLSNVGAAG
jgi:hypothetical protein